MTWERPGQIGGGLNAGESVVVDGQLRLVNGAAVAGGAGLVTVCDLAVSVPDARFGYPEVRRGLVAAMVMPHLVGPPLSPGTSSYP